MLDKMMRDLGYRVDILATEQHIRELQMVEFYLKNWRDVTKGEALTNFFMINYRDTSTLRDNNTLITTL